MSQYQGKHGKMRLFQSHNFNLQLTLELTFTADFLSEFYPSFLVRLSPKSHLFTSPEDDGDTVRPKKIRKAGMKECKYHTDTT